MKLKFSLNNLLFINFYNYTKNESIDRVRLRIKSIENHENSENITGVLKADNSFVLTPFISFVNINRNGMPSYLNGTLLEEDKKTKIEIKIKPNLTLIFFFYFLILVFLIKILGKDLNTFEFDINYNLYLPVLTVIIYIVIKYYCNLLKTNFEKLLSLKSNA